MEDLGHPYYDIKVVLEFSRRGDQAPRRERGATPNPDKLVELPGGWRTQYFLIFWRSTIILDIYERKFENLGFVLKNLPFLRAKICKPLGYWWPFGFTYLSYGLRFPDVTGKFPPPVAAFPTGTMDPTFRHPCLKIRTINLLHLGTPEGSRAKLNLIIFWFTFKAPAYANVIHRSLEPVTWIPFLNDLF